LLVLRHLATRPSFLMVGTIEPRKGYLEIIEAFTQLWEEGVDVNLVIVGSEGWKGLPVEMRRNIPQTVAQLSNHHELGKRLFWLEGISDEYLEKVYVASTCFIAASEGEGFGLPLIEAAQHGVPIIARDIPVFREIAREYAFYFRNTESGVLACVLRDWLELFESGRHPKSNALPRLTWRQSTEALKKVIFEGDWHGKVGKRSSAIQLVRDIDSKGICTG
jgi:glycosyltransferase involved in cell wall biosynthesis